MKRAEVVTAVIVREGRILLTQRKRSSPLAFRWGGPGGEVKPGETHTAALARELGEEIGVSIVGHLDKPLWTTLLDPPDVDKALYVVTYLVYASAASPEATPREGQGLGWFLACEVAALPLTPADEAHRREILELLRRAA